MGAERVDQFELLYQHEDEVFGDLDINDGENADYTWFDEDHSSFYLVPYAEGVCSLPLPGCWASVCAAFVRLARNPQFDNLVNGTIGLVAVAFIETGLESASTQLGDLVREKVIPEFVAGQQKRAKFPTSKAPFSAISTRFG